MKKREDSIFATQICSTTVETTSREFRTGGSDSTVRGGGRLPIRASVIFALLYYGSDPENNSAMGRGC